MSTDTTLVLGATGKTGRRVAARLRLAGTPVRAASQSSHPRFDWNAPGRWDTRRGSPLRQDMRAVEDDGARAAVAGAWTR